MCSDKGTMSHNGLFPLGKMGEEKLGLQGVTRKLRVKDVHIITMVISLCMQVKITRLSVSTTYDMLHPTRTRIKLFKAVCAASGVAGCSLLPLHILQMKGQDRGQLSLEPGWASFWLDRHSVCSTCVSVPRV